MLPLEAFLLQLATQPQCSLPLVLPLDLPGHQSLHQLLCQKQTCKHFQLETPSITALQEAVRKLNDAQATLEDVHKAAAAQEAAQAAAEALHPWPADAQLVPSVHPKYPPAQPQLLHPDVATLGSYLSSLPGGIQTCTDSNSPGTGSQHACAVEAGSTETGTNAAAHMFQGQNSSAAGDNRQQHDGASVLSTGTDSSEANGGKLVSGWQRRLQTAMSQQQLHQVCLSRSLLPWHEQRICQAKL